MDFDPFDKNVPVPLDVKPQGFNDLYAEWPDRETARLYWEYVHEADVRRAANPPEISVTLPGLPGIISAVPGSGMVAWKVPVSPLCTSRCRRSRPRAGR